METNTFKGWTNKETWFYSLDLFNDDVSYSYWNHKAYLLAKHLDAVNILAKEMKEYALSEAKEAPCNLIEDLITHSIDQIDFEELAEELLNRVSNNNLVVLH